MPLWLEDWLEVFKLITLLLVQFWNVLVILLVSINVARCFNIANANSTTIFAMLWLLLLDNGFFKLGRCLWFEVELIHWIFFVHRCGVSFEVAPHIPILKKERFVRFKQWVCIGSGSVKPLLNLIYFLLALRCFLLVVSNQIHNLRHIYVFAIVWLLIEFLLFHGGLFNW